MKYIVRAIKYFAYLAIILCIFIVLLSLFGVVGSTLDDIFKDGAASLWKIAGIIAVFAAIYPHLGFGRRNAFVPGAYDEIRLGVVDLMHDRGYVLEDERISNSASSPPLCASPACSKIALRSPAPPPVSSSKAR